MDAPTSRKQKMKARIHAVMTPGAAAGMMIRSAMTVVRQLAKDQHELADIVIEPQIAHIRPDQIKKREELRRLGEEAARANIPQIRDILNGGG